MFKSPLWLLLFFVALVAANAPNVPQMDPPTKLLGGTIRQAPNCNRKIGANARITLHYKASVWGEKTLYENTYNTKPAFFRLGRDTMIKGLEQGIKGMCVGEVRRLLIPADLAYGEVGLPGSVPPNSAIVYEIELVDTLSPWRNPLFWIGIAGFITAYYIYDKNSKGADEVKASKFLESKASAASAGAEGGAKEKSA
ncbi:hypothetical protein CLU79DRAFT_720050 [Phycomyces nitens]|nr:hypothetical protein CLU79DRAFT_720050 [Phycomyces nitens]